MNEKQLLASIRTDKASVEEKKRLQRELTAEQQLELNEKAAALAKTMINGVMPALHQALSKTPPSKPKKTIIIPD